MAEIKGKKDAVLAGLEKGTAMEDLIKQYSDDYKEITEEMTVSEKESYELQNKTMLEDGLIINDQGIFSESLATYYSITVDEDIVDKVFALKNGEYAAVTIDDSIWVVQRFDHKEKESYFTDVKDSVFKTLYADDLAAKHTDWRSRLNYVYNEAVIDAYRPEYLSDLFKFSQTSGT
jgi:molybdopterin converting factor small subunit